MKTCTRCEKPIESDPFKQCSLCREAGRRASHQFRQRNPEMAKEHQRRARNKHPERYAHSDKEYWKKRRFAKYGLTEIEWLAMFYAQQERCAACESDNPGGGYWHTDHDHETGQVRGILCHHCNVTLGLVKDSPHHLQALKDYLEVQL